MVVRMNEYVEERLSGPEQLGRTYSRELTIESVARQGGHAVVGSVGVLHQERTQLPTHAKNYFDKRGQSDAKTLLEEAGVKDDSTEFYRLSDDEIYYVEFAEDIDIPEGHVGLVSPQETLMRAGIEMNAPLVGPDEDTAEGLIAVENNSVLLQDSSSVAELVVLEPKDTE